MSVVPTIKLFSSDLNGTLVRQHTMSDMIRVYLGARKFVQAQAVFARQTSRIGGMEKAFNIAGPLTRGLTLRQAIEYAGRHIRFVDGLEEFLAQLQAAGVTLVINSTSYSVTVYALRERLGHHHIHGQICNLLEFGENADARAALSEQELEQLVMDYFGDPDNPLYDRLQASGRVQLGIEDEAAKATKIFDYARQHFPQLEREQIAHMGDSMGDSLGIYEVAAQGGLGIGFSYNEPLRAFLHEKLSTEKLRGKIVLAGPKDGAANLMNVIRAIERAGYRLGGRA